MIEISNNSNNHGKPAVHLGRPVEKVVLVIYLGSVSTALVEKFRISPSRQSRKPCQNFFYLEREIGSGFFLDETLMESVMRCSCLLQSQKYKAHGSFPEHFKQLI